MKLNKVLLGMSLVASTFSTLATDFAPVVDLNAAAVNPIDQVKELKLAARNRAQVNLQLQVDELQSEVNKLRGITELHEHKLNQMSERQRELYQEIERRVNNALKSTRISSVANVQANSDNQVNYSNNLTENEAYDHAVNLVLKDKLYEQAIPAFKQFNQKFPQSSYAANAHYWLGQLLFNKAEFSLAESEFLIVVNKFNDSTKRADALLKLGMVRQKQGENSASITLYRQLIKEYPNSTAAQLAKPRLSSLTQ
jgi:tol-pal system protein YbgF|tara:strand:+ start:517 stop:1278 length:762 start_codon:yes stop_codon:yes gene_type:complete